MRLDFFLDPAYLLGSLWGVFPGTPVCGSRAAVLPMTARAEVTAFVDVNVVPMDTERVLANHTVLVEGGRITALGPASKVAVPKGAVRVDGRGKYLMPGLTDMHAHLHMYLGSDDEPKAKRHLASYLSYGVTAVRHLGGGGDQFIRYRAPNTLGPRLYLAPSLKPLWSTTPDSVAAIVATYKSSGYDFVEVPANYIQMPRERRVVYDSLMAAARRSGVPVSSHTNGESYEEMLAFGRFGGSVEHLYAFRDTLKGSAADVPAAKIQAVAAEVKRAGTWMDVTLDCVEERKKPPALEVARQLVKAMQDVGVKLLVGADADLAHGTSPGVTHEEIAELVRAGLTPYQAFVASTRHAAEFLGILDSAGTVAIGKRADLVLLAANPLVNVRNAIEPVGVMVGGRWLDRAALDAGMIPSMKAWFSMEIASGMLPPPYNAGLSAPFLKFNVLADSLDQAASSATLGAMNVRLLPQIAEALGAMRPFFTPEQREVFDPQVRIWAREQTRKGHPVTVASVTAAP